MSKTVISVENLSKSYHLGQIGTGTLTNDLKVWWAKKTGKPNPMLKIGQADHGNMDGETLWALKDVSFQLEQGEVLGIIGRNGAGKSTLLKILSRVTAPTDGCVKAKGRIASLLEVGTGFHPDLTGRENIYLNGAILGMSKQEVTRKFDEIVDFAEVEKFIDTPVKRYSSGMYVRLAFAVAAHMEPEILIVDEVLAVGDAEFQKKCLGKMGNVAREGRTILFVSHTMAAIQSLCTRCLILGFGDLVFDGSTKQAIEKYLSQITLTGGNQQLSSDIVREGNGFSRFSGIFFHDAEGKKIEHILMGKDFQIRLDFTCQQPLQRPLFNVTLINQQGDRLIAARSHISLGQLPACKKGGSITCCITNPGLSPGNYHVTISMYDANSLVDRIQEAVMITVVPQDIYGTGKLLKAGDSLICPPIKWIIDYK